MSRISGPQNGLLLDEQAGEPFAVDSAGPNIASTDIFGRNKDRHKSRRSKREITLPIRSLTPSHECMQESHNSVGTRPQATPDSSTNFVSVTDFLLTRSHFISGFSADGGCVGD